MNAPNDPLAQDLAISRLERKRLRGKRWREAIYDTSVPRPPRGSERYPLPQSVRYADDRP